MANIYRNKIASIEERYSGDFKKIMKGEQIYELEKTYVISVDAKIAIPKANRMVMVLEGYQAKNNHHDCKKCKYFLFCDMISYVPPKSTINTVFLEEAKKVIQEYNNRKENPVPKCMLNLKKEVI